jgi:hypothetical protein
MANMNLNDDLRKLADYKEFAHFLAYVRDMREGSIRDLVAAPTERVQQISGSIVAYDTILAAANADVVLARHRE